MDDRQLLRDLTWCIEAPSLINAPSWDGLQPLQSLLAEAKLAAPPIVKPAPRLGHYYEQLWQHLLTDRLSWPLVAANRQISTGGKTLGALDLLHYAPSINTYCHTELAVKFYLRHESGDAQHHWIGPNAIDRLDIKMQRLTNHQLPLPQRRESKAAIDAWIASESLPNRECASWQSKMVVQGWLFHPLQEQPKPAHASINPQHLRGHWLHHSAAIPQSAQSAHWILLPRLYWLARALIKREACVHSDSIGCWQNLRLNQPVHLTAKSLAHCLRQQQNSAQPQALLLAAVVPDGNYWREIDRWMLVPDGWPQPRTRSALPPFSK